MATPTPTQERISVLLEKKDKERLKRQAKRQRISLSDVIRMKLTARKPAA